MEQRSILFRGKRLDNGEWVYGGYFKHDTVKTCFSTDDPKTKHYIVCDGSCDWAFEPPLEWFEVDSKTVGLFTGQYDECGDPIFEGDIVYCESEDENAVIDWDEDTSRFVIQFDDGWISDFDHFYGYDLEVIYSIFDESEEIDLFDEEE